MCRYKFEPGVHFVPEKGGGVLLPQVYVRTGAGEVRFSDDEIFAPGKRCMFQPTIMLKSPRELSQALEGLEDIDRLSDGYLSASEATILVEDLQAVFSIITHSRLRTMRVASGDEFAASQLCEGRPKPKSYDPFHIGKKLLGKRYIVLLPDRFVLAACGSMAELVSAASHIEPLLSDTNRTQTRSAKL